jgi:hypothetical protein
VINRIIWGVCGCLLILSCTSEAVPDDERSIATVAGAAAEDTTAAVLARQRAFFHALSTRDPSAATFVQKGFRTFNQEDSTYIDWQTPPLFGHDSVSIRALADRLGRAEFTSTQFEVLPYRDGSVTVIASEPAGNANIIVWEKLGTDWTARGMRVNASAEWRDFVRANSASRLSK